MKAILTLVMAAAISVVMAQSATTAPQKDTKTGTAAVAACSCCKKDAVSCGCKCTKEVSCGCKCTKEACKCTKEASCGCKCKCTKEACKKDASKTATDKTAKK